MIRKAKIVDGKIIYSLINTGAKEGKLLQRSLNHVYEHIRDFWVYVQDRKIVGCCALSAVGWQDLGEIRSLIVVKKFQHKGIGVRLVKKCISEAKTLGVKDVFALTFIPGFFKRLGFKSIDREKLPHKIWSDCINCSYFPNCREQAVILKKGGV